MQMVCVAGGRTDVEKEETPVGITPNVPGIFVFQTVRPPPTWFADHWGEGDLFARNPKGPLPSGERQIVPPQWGDGAAPKRQRQQSWGDNEGAWYGMAQSFRVDGTGDHCWVALRWS
jgi:hypothetical protein